MEDRPLEEQELVERARSGDVGAYEQGIETASHLNTMYTMPPAFGVQGPMSADAI